MGEGWRGGGSGVLQREIPSITPWASYIRDYFSFLSPASNHPPFFSSLVFTFLSLPSSFSSGGHVDVPASLHREEGLRRGFAGGNVQKSSA